jgi:hypothetical protein
MFARFSAVLLITGLAFAAPSGAKASDAPLFAFGPDEGAAAAMLVADVVPDDAEARAITLAASEPSFAERDGTDWPVKAVAVDPDRFLGFHDETVALASAELGEFNDFGTGSVLPLLDELELVRPRCEAHAFSGLISVAALPGETRAAYEARLTP